MSAPFHAFASAIAESPDPDERRRLGDALRAARFVAAMPDADDRQCVLRVLEQMDALVALADDLATGRVVPFPRHKGELYFVD